MAVTYVGDGSLAPAEEARWYVWWRGATYRGPTVFQASPFEGHVAILDQSILVTDATPPPGVDAHSFVHSFVVRNLGSTPSYFQLWAWRKAE